MLYIALICLCSPQASILPGQLGKSTPYKTSGKHIVFPSNVFIFHIVYAKNHYTFNAHF